MAFIYRLGSQVLLARCTPAQREILEKLGLEDKTHGAFNHYLSQFAPSSSISPHIYIRRDLADRRKFPLRCKRISQPGWNRREAASTM